MLKHLRAAQVCACALVHVQIAGVLSHAGVHAGMDAFVEGPAPSALRWKSMAEELIRQSATSYLARQPIIQVIGRHGTRKFTPTVLAKFGYFFIGLEPRVWWWGLLVKRADVALCMMIGQLNN